MSYQKKSESLAQAVVALVNGRVNDAPCYRYLIDNLYAFRVGSVNGTGKWDTRKIREHCPWTVLARKSNKVHKEHVVPMAEIVRILLSYDKPQVTDIYDVVDKYCTYCMVTPEEHEALNKDYRHKMPSGFWEKGSDYYMDIWARYKLANVAYQL